MKALTTEQYQELAKTRGSFQTLNYDAVIVKFKKSEQGMDLPIVEEAYLIADLIEVLKAL